MTNVIFSPEDISRILGQFPPTDEQKAIITADHTRPAVVIAGAGSGKTETMSTKLIYLIANGLVEPDRVLGLTFTRKSASDLAIKVRKSLKILEKSDEYKRALDTGLVHAHSSISQLGEPTISTYHSYAARVVREHSLRMGIEPPEHTLGEAAAWQQVERIARNYDGDMNLISSPLSTVISSVMKLVTDLLENEVDPKELIAEAERFTDAISGKTPYRKSDKLSATREAETVQYGRLQLIPIVEEVIRHRKSRAEFTFDDQMVLAAQLASDFPEVGEIERAKFHVVLLDEYQDTSTSQLRLMRGLFGGGHPITAVGDPLQAIYTWRGASSETIEAFPRDFCDAAGAPAQMFTLSTSWRNDKRILDLANEISAPLREKNQITPVLQAKPSAVDGVISGGIYNSPVEEAQSIASALLPYWNAEARSRITEYKQQMKIDPSFRCIESTAVLVRNRSQIPEIEMALRAHGIPVEIVGIDGLIDVPEVAEVRAVLSVIANSDESSSLIKLMSGGSWRIGIRDMSALAKVAKDHELEANEGKRINLVDRVIAGGTGEEDELSRASIIETLNNIEDFTQEERSLFSDVGFTRLQKLALSLRKLRSLIHLPIPDLIQQAERELHLGVDVAMTDHGRRYLDKFMDVATSFYSQGGSLRSFLAWLKVTSKEERGLRAGGVEVRKDVVQILTVHSAKGGEWDLVVLPGLADGIFPSSKGGENWLQNEGVIPFSFRADKSRLPTLDFHNDTSAQDVANRIKSFGHLCNEVKLQEERRLMYVAVTRAKFHLIATTSWWHDGKEPKDPSEYFQTIAEHIEKTASVFDGSFEDKPQDSVNPNREKVLQESWPIDPLGAKRELIARNIEEIFHLSQSENFPELEVRLREAENHPLKVAVDLTLHEFTQRQREEREVRVHLPRHLSVSALMTLADSPEEYAARLRRPLPFKPDPIARRGTAFHTWLESRFADVIPLISDEEMPGAMDEGALDESALEKLKEKWLRSSWANRTPYEVEVPFERSVDGTILRGRMDAVYKDDDETFDVVDWKTGSAKTGDALQIAAIQLAVYRLAWAEIAGVPIEKVRAAFHYVSSEETVRPSDLLDEEGLLQLIRGIPLLTE